MDRKLVLGLFMGFLTVFSFTAKAQKPGNIRIKVSPQFLFINGYHFEIEKKLSGPKDHSIAFSPHIYAGKTKLVDSFNGRNSELGQPNVKGYGAEILYKVSSPEVKDAPNELITITYGLNFHHFEVGFEQEGWAEEADKDGLLYYKKKLRPYTEKINRWGAVIMVGPKSKFITDRIFADLYMGMGASYSKNRSDYFEPRYNVNFLDFGNSGAYFLAGLKLGMVL